MPFNLTKARQISARFPWHSQRLKLPSHIAKAEWLLRVVLWPVWCHQDGLSPSHPGLIWPDRRPQRAGCV